MSGLPYIITFTHVVLDKILHYHTHYDYILGESSAVAEVVKLLIVTVKLVPYPTYDWARSQSY